MWPHMRSERLLGILAVLQARGRCTAPALADEFDVSVKTIRRDLEALSRCGVPVFSCRGAGGGWELLPDYRSSLIGLTAEEALAIVLGRPQSLLGDLGFQTPGARAMGKLLGTLPGRHRERAVRASERLLIDRDLWSFAAEPEPHLADLYRAACDDVAVRLRYTDATTRFEVEPLGLVYKREAWYLFARRGDEYRTYRVSRIRELTVTSRSFSRPAGFDLPTEWNTATANYAAAVPSYQVHVRLRDGALERVSGIALRSRHVGEPGPDGWAAGHLRFFDEADAVRGILLLGRHVEITSPGSLRKAIVDYATDLLRDNASPRQGETARPHQGAARRT
jgi:predicted DNA-binding transcriptional regulator YafY